jgi:hypothetical protein
MKLTCRWVGSCRAAATTLDITGNDIVWSRPARQSWQYVHRRLQSRVPLTINEA